MPMPWLIATLLATLLLFACDRQPPTLRPVTTGPAATAPHEAPPTTTAAASRPTVSFLLVNEQMVSFPRARLRLMDRQPTLNVLLFSDDPRQAISDKYEGNSFYFEMELDVSDPADLTAAAWSWRAASSERQDTPTGIFLDGGRKQLQPYNAQVVFSGESARCIASISGQFLLFHTHENIPAQTVWVRGELPVELELK